MTAKFPKDAWINRAIIQRYIVPNKDGTILRRQHDGTYVSIKFQVHKKTGRVYYNMTFEKITKSVLVNRVIALRYLPNPLDLPQVNHIDGDKENNSLANLEWSSGSDNEKHAHRTGLKTGRGSSNSNAKLTVDQVIEIRNSNALTDDLAKFFGVSKSTIRNIVAGKTWTHV